MQDAYRQRRLTESYWLADSSRPGCIGGRGEADPPDQCRRSPGNPLVPRRDPPLRAPPRHRLAPARRCRRTRPVNRAVWRASCAARGISIRPRSLTRSQRWFIAECRPKLRKTTNFPCWFTGWKGPRTSWRRTRPTKPSSLRSGHQDCADLFRRIHSRHGFRPMQQPAAAWNPSPRSLPQAGC